MSYMKKTKKECVDFINELKLFTETEVNKSWLEVSVFSEKSKYGDERHIQSKFSHGKAIGLGIIKKKIFDFMNPTNNKVE